MDYIEDLKYEDYNPMISIQNHKVFMTLFLVLSFISNSYLVVKLSLNNKNNKIFTVGNIVTGMVNGLFTGLAFYFSLLYMVITL